MRASSLVCGVFVSTVAVAAAQSGVSKATVPGVVNFGYIGNTVSCAGATSPGALAEVKKLGYASVINLRVATEPRRAGGPSKVIYDYASVIIVTAGPQVFR